MNIKYRLNKIKKNKIYVYTKMVYYIIVLTTLKEDMSNKISELTNNEVPINFESNVITFYYLIHRIKDLLIKR